MKRINLLSIRLFASIMLISSVVLVTPANVFALLVTTECTVTGNGALATGDEFSGNVSSLTGTITGTWEHWTPDTGTGGCDELQGAAYGLCTAYCQAMQCDSAEQQASDTACDRVYNNYVKINGDAPPCANTQIHFIGQADELHCFLNGGTLFDIRGTGTVNGEPGFSFIASGHDTLPDTYWLFVTDADGNVVVDTGGDLASGDISIIVY